MSQHVPRGLEEVRPEEALLGLLTFNLLYAGSHPEKHEEVSSSGVLIEISILQIQHVSILGTIHLLKDFYLNLLLFGVILAVEKTTL